MAEIKHKCALESAECELNRSELPLILVFLLVCETHKTHPITHRKTHEK